MRFTLTLLTMLAVPFAAWAEPVPVVVELFTSQGCSSCPPADAFLTELAHDHDVLPLAWHITYWDRLGWRDPYALADATRRQEAYARAFGDGQVYTPEAVVNGATGVVGSDRPAVNAAIAAARAAPTVALRVTRDADGVAVTIGAGAGSGTLLVIGYDTQHDTAIGRGENGGRTLRESNIVRALVPAGTWHGEPLTLHAPLPAGERVAALLQQQSGSILGAARLVP